MAFRLPLLCHRGKLKSMARFVLEGGATLSGSIPVYGSKNAALPLLAARWLTDQEVTLTNIPEISDVAAMMEIERRLKDGQNVDALVGKLRGSILLLGALIGRERRASIPLPGGDIIGARPIDAHLDGFRQLGADVRVADGRVEIDGAQMRAGEVTLPEFSVTATENILLAAATLPGTTTIYTAAAEPHVAALCELLSRMGAQVTGAGTHTITIEGTPQLRGAEFENIPDMLEAGFFILLAAVTKSTLTIEGVPTADLRLFFKKLAEIGVQFTIDGTTVHVTPSDLRSFRLQVLPHPGIATDLQAPFAVVATQATGSSLIHDPLYESRFKHIDELAKMGADAVVCDPHRVIITGPTSLRGREIASLDIRSGATLLMAGLIAEGQTVIHDAEIIDRGYAKLSERLQAVGANIKRVED